MIHLVPSRDDYTAKGIVELMFVEGLPRAIVSDHDVLFHWHVLGSLKPPDWDKVEMSNT